MSRAAGSIPHISVTSDSDLTDDESNYDTISEEAELDINATRLTMEEELQLQQDEEEEEEELRETGLYTFLKRPAVVYPMETLQIVLTMAWTGAYVYLADRNFVYPAILRGMMYGWALFFVFFWAWKVVVKENRLKYMISLFAIMDYLTIIPFFINTPWLNPLMCVRIVCLWRLFRVFPTTISPVVRSVLKLICSIFMLVYISAAFLLAVEPEVMNDFVTASYFATVTISTVGYGDLHMNHDSGRVLVILIILTAFVFIPWQGYFLSKIIAMTPAPWQRSLDVDVRKYRHVVLMGKITRARVSMFLREFLTPSNDNYRVVILDAEDQGESFQNYIKDSGFYKRVHYYVGSPVNDHDLHRVHLAEASAAFIWSDTTSASPEQADRLAVLTCLAVKSHSYWLKTYVEVILPETKARIGEVGPNMFVMSYQEMKYGALSRACEVDGLLAFCSVLLTTFGPPSSTTPTMDSNMNIHVDNTPRVPMLGVLPGHTGDQTNPGPSPALLAEAALRRGESHETRLRASLSGRPAKFKINLNSHHTHGSHHSFAVKSKAKPEALKDTLSNKFKAYSGSVSSPNYFPQHNPYLQAKPASKSYHPLPLTIQPGQTEPEAPLNSEPITPKDITEKPTLEIAYKEYLWTRTCQLELLVVPATFAERTFMEAASSLYTTYGVILIGLRAMNGQLELNPGREYTVRGGEAAYIIGRPRDVRQLRQTFDRMARDDGTASHGPSGKTLEYALDPRLEHSPFAPRSIRKSTADESFAQSVQAAAAATLQDFEPFDYLKASHHVMDTPRTYQDAQKIPENQPPKTHKDGPRQERYHTFTPSGTHTHQHPISAVSFGPPTPTSRPKLTSLSKSTSHIHMVSSIGGASSSTPASAAASPSSPSSDGTSPLNASSSSTNIATGANADFAGLNDHILFCAHTDAIDWYALVMPLRSKLVSTQRDIVIVTECPIDEEQWEWLSFFGRVWVVEGSPLVASDLARAQIESCSTIVILSSPRLGEDESVVDEKALVVYNSVKAHFSHKRIVLDLAKPSNSRLASPEVGRVGIYENPEFIAGHMYDAALHDTIMAKSFDMPFLMDLTHTLLNCNDDGASIITVPVPDNCKGAHFEALFAAFPECIPLGLLRRNPVPALRKFPYVAICPPQSAIVGPKDQVFLLAPKSFMLKRAKRAAKGPRANRRMPHSSRMKFHV